MKIHDLEVDEYLSECVRINSDNLQEEFCRVPADLAYWGERMADAAKDAKLAKLHREKTESVLYAKHRAELSNFGKTTEAAIRAAVVDDPAYEKAKIREIEADAAATAFKNRFWAVSAKKDLVQSLGATIRVEMQRDPLVRVPDREDF